MQGKQKAALVFGGSRGIGAAAVERLAKEGFAVSFTYARDEKAAQTVAEKVKSFGGQANFIKADSGEVTEIQSAVLKAVEQFGKIDVVVVNTGVLKLGVIDSFSVEDLDLTIKVNVRGVYLSIQAVVPHVNDKGRIITIGSNAALHTSNVGASAYQFSKAAVTSMVKGIALDLAPRKITVNNIQPGPIATDMLGTAGIGPSAQRSPLKRVGQPEEVASLIAYLAGDESGYMTGASLTMDGGWTL